MTRGSSALQARKSHPGLPGCAVLDMLSSGDGAPAA